MRLTVAIAKLLFPRMLPATVENIEEAWLPAAEAELTALAAEAEMVDRMPDTLLLRPPPPGGVDLITPDPRYARYRPNCPSLWLQGPPQPATIFFASCLMVHIHPQRHRFLVRGYSQGVSVGPPQSKPKLRGPSPWNTQKVKRWVGCFSYAHLGTKMLRVFFLSLVASKSAAPTNRASHISTCRYSCSWDQNKPCFSRRGLGFWCGQTGTRRS